jgi:hypothetical protein
LTSDQESIPIAVGLVDSIPTLLDELDRSSSTTYDLSVSAAASLDIPVVGSVSGGENRRVVILERKSWKEVVLNQSTFYYGYAIRFAITVNKLDASMKLGLAYLSAAAQVGLIEGKWSLSTVGLSGVKIDSVSIPPQELNVETFVLAKQSLQALIGAVRDPSTRFSAIKLAEIKSEQQLVAEYRKSIARTYALARIKERKTLQQAINDLPSGNGREVFQGDITDFYISFVGIANPTDPISIVASGRAAQFLLGVVVNPR